MADTTLKSLSYRTFDQLINEVYTDLPSFTREGMVEPAQLIKVAQKINYELGLKIYKTKETILEMELGRAKLPNDFYILNLALLCSHYEVCEPGLFNGLHTENIVTPVQNPLTLPQLTTCPCWQIVNPTDQAIETVYTNCHGQEVEIIYPAGITINLCASVVPNELGLLDITLGSFCYNDPDTGNFSCNPFPAGCDCNPPLVDDCAVVNADPWKQNKVFTTCDGTMQVNVIQYNGSEVRKYTSFEAVYMVPSKQASAFCINANFRNTRHTGNIRDGYIYIPTMRDCNGNNGHGLARVYICYLGSMEDDEGNLLVLDHPKINEYYELALSERIFRNNYLNGEPDIERRYQLLKADLAKARAECLSIVATPDFMELRLAIEHNRRSEYHKYMHPFSSLFSSDWPWAYNTEFV